METSRESKGRPEGWSTEPRSDEAALWTFINAVGQLVLTGWAATVGTMLLILGVSFLQSPTGFPQWVNGVAAALFILVGAVLIVFTFRLLSRALKAFWVTFRKVLFIYDYSRKRDGNRALQVANGDPVLEPYLRYLVRNGYVKLQESDSDRPL
jgi:hypothetical protein